jgi:hypothetical protein
MYVASCGYNLKDGENVRRHHWNKMPLPFNDNMSERMTLGGRYPICDVALEILAPSLIYLERAEGVKREAIRECTRAGDAAGEWLAEICERDKGRIISGRWIYDAELTGRCLLRAAAIMKGERVEDDIALAGSRGDIRSLLGGLQELGNEEAESFLEEFNVPTTRDLYGTEPVRAGLTSVQLLRKVARLLRASLHAEIEGGRLDAVDVGRAMWDTLTVNAAIDNNEEWPGGEDHSLKLKAGLEALGPRARVLVNENGAPPAVWDEYWPFEVAGGQAMRYGFDKPYQDPKSYFGAGWAKQYRQFLEPDACPQLSDGDRQILDGISTPSDIRTGAQLEALLHAAAAEILESVESERLDTCTDYLVGFTRLIPERKLWGVFIEAYRVYNRKHKDSDDNCYCPFFYPIMEVMYFYANHLQRGRQRGFTIISIEPDGLPNSDKFVPCEYRTIWGGILAGMRLMGNHAEASAMLPLIPRDARAYAAPVDEGRAAQLRRLSKQTKIRDFYYRSAREFKTYALGNRVIQVVPEGPVSELYMYDTPEEILCVGGRIGETWFFAEVNLVKRKWETSLYDEENDDFGEGLITLILAYYSDLVGPPIIREAFYETTERKAVIGSGTIKGKKRSMPITVYMPRKIYEVEPDKPLPTGAKRAPHPVVGHPRKLSPRQQMSMKAKRKAEEFNMPVPEGYTFVPPYHTGRAPAGLETTKIYNCWSAARLAEGIARRPEKKQRLRSTDK